MPGKLWFSVSSSSIDTRSEDDVSNYHTQPILEKSHLNLVSEDEKSLLKSFPEVKNLWNRTEYRFDKRYPNFCAVTHYLAQTPRRQAQHDTINLKSICGYKIYTKKRARRKCYQWRGVGSREHGEAVQLLQEGRGVFERATKMHDITTLPTWRVVEVERGI
jgi:hypothetical protein